ncbi:hypothetical protein CVT24_000150 [Panaeolus cyanescens]|uniref:Nucleoporin Nup188 N-terminal subdomain III domain-containing protein n=1 Tax=Panaeolus cyanescens TaxID=181874 RepID=A0A409VIW2_9AGAR|nr:hypothetical protein CVT24_000150 [Panaeolus cyanescens]
MSGESSKRSDLIDLTYSQLHYHLTCPQDGFNPATYKGWLSPRIEQLKNVSNRFGTPSDASKKKIESGSVTLPDGFVVRVEDADKDFVFAISSKFQIDQVQSLILLRSFFYNQGLPSLSETDSKPTVIEELLTQIEPFYHHERLSSLCLLIPLFRANSNDGEALYEIASDILPQIVPDGPKFAQNIIDEYVRKTKEKLPERYNQDPKGATTWAKQNLKEQLHLLEVLFWTMWSFVSCTGPLVESIFETAYRTGLGSVQANNMLILDEGSRQLQQDCAATWILISIEVLELEALGEPDTIELSDTPSKVDVYYCQPETLKRLHDLITSHTGSQYSCMYLAWTYVLSRFSAKAAETSEIPASYQSFFDYLSPPSPRGYTQDREPIHVQMAKTCLEPDVGLLPLIQSLLTASPLFVTVLAWKLGSSVTSSNSVAYRSVLKGLIIGLVELIPVEMIPDFEGLVNIWVSLFGRSESVAVTGICAQFWTLDWKHGMTRRAIFDVARSRFPIQVRPLVRLLRAMTGAGFLDTDSLYAQHFLDEENISPERLGCERYVYHYLHDLPSFSQVIPSGACSGPHALYERQTERFGTSTSPGLTYINLRPIQLPGGTVLPARSVGRLLSGDGGENVVVAWQFKNSGWKLILEVLTDYVNRKRMDFGAGGKFGDVSFAKRTTSQAVKLTMNDIGVDVEGEEEDTVTDALDLIRSVIQDNPTVANLLIQSLESGEPVVSHTTAESEPPDLVQLTTMILEEALSRSNVRARSPSRTKLITSAMSVLASLLGIPPYSNRVWLYIRSTTTLFGADRTAGFTSAALAAERSSGQYTMTLTLLRLVEQLFKEATLSIVPDNQKLQQLKEEVLLRAAKFVHTEIWVEHLSWKYNQVGDRFDIGARILSLYIRVFENFPPSTENGPFSLLSKTIADVLLFKATTSTINPLVSSLSSAGQILHALYAQSNYGDSRRLLYLLRSILHLSRLVLTYKAKTDMASKPCLLEQAFCARIAGGAPSQDKTYLKRDPIDVMASYVRDKDLGETVPLEALLTLTALCQSLANSHPSPPTIIGHLSNPEATVTSFVRLVQDPYEDLSLRKAIWDFISLAVDKEPALATLFVTGKSRSPEPVYEHKMNKKKPEEAPRVISALNAARDVLVTWKGLWDANPLLLSCVFRFLDTVWQHALEHKAVLEPLQSDPEFWDQIVAVATREVGPVPTYDTTDFTYTEGARHSNLHEAVQMHSYRNSVKSHAIRILTRDIGLYLQLHGTEVPLKKPESYNKLERHIRSHEQLTDLLAEAAPSSYAPNLYDAFSEMQQSHFNGLELHQLAVQDPPQYREYGDNFGFSVPLLRMRLQAYTLPANQMEDPSEQLEKLLFSINLNLSLAQSETALLESWEALLRQVIPYLRADAAVRSTLLSIAASISYDVSQETREGDMMASIHGTRLSTVLALLEVAWFSSTDKKNQIDPFMDIVRNLRGIITNEAQSPTRSLLSTLPTPFHRVLLQIIFFCIKQSRSLLVLPKLLHAEQRLAIGQTVEVVLSFVIDALRVVFMTARSRADLDVDRDMELLVAVFEQCTSPEIDASSAYWLSRCQETDVIRGSLELFVHIDLVGLSDLPLLLSRKQPLYAPHIFRFHMALASNPLAAERFAGEGILAAYSNNFISSAISSGLIDIGLPELPGQRSPAHLAYCSMVSIVATVINALGRQNHYFDAEACGFVQLYGDQISRALSWTIGDPITIPLLEEIDQVVNLFYAIASSVPAAARPNVVVDKVLRVFTSHALQLIQQINYAITHPNHLASLYEPVTQEERVKMEKAQSQTDPMKRPYVTHLIHRLFKLSSNIFGTLVTISRADTILLTSAEDWPLNQALIAPSSKVVLGEPASLGTLLELGNRTLDVLRHLVQKPAGQSIVDTTEVDVKQGVKIARRNLEEILLYSVTQLAMWFSKPDFDAGPSDPDVDDPQAMDVSRADAAKERRPPRSSMTMAERLRRGMTGEMSGDLHSLLTKSKPVLASSDSILGKGSVDLSQVLLNFLHERVGTSS